MIRVGFEPTPFRTSALSWRLRPLGHLTFVEVLQLASSLSGLGSSTKQEAVYSDLVWKAIRKYKTDLLIFNK